MKFDPNMLKILLSQSDEVLWQSIQRIATANGIRLPSAMPPAAEMSRLRQLLSGLGSSDPAEAERIIEEYKKRGNGHG